MPMGTPPPGNYRRAAEQTAAGSAAAVNQQTQANRPTTSTPFAGTNWTQDASGNWTMSNQFAPGMQEAANLGQQSLIDALRKGIPSADAARQQAIDASYGQATSRLDPMWQRREEAQRTQLLNQGLDPNSQAARSAMGELGQQRNDAYTSAMNAAIGQGTAAGESAFRQNLASAQLPMQQLGAMYGLLGQPSFNAAGQAQAPNYLGALGLQDQAALQRWQQEQQAQADLIGGGSQAVGNAAQIAWILSDERTKMNVERLGVDALPGVPWARFEYRHAPGVPQLGVIAQDLEKVAPRYVREDERGLKWVDLSFLDEVGRG